MNETQTKVVVFNGIRYKIYLTDDERGASRVHIERQLNSNVFEKMTVAEIKGYIAAMLKDYMPYLED